MSASPSSPASASVSAAQLQQLAQQVYAAASDGGIQVCDRPHGRPDVTGCPFTSRLAQRVVALAAQYPDADPVCACQSPPDAMTVGAAAGSAIVVTFVYAGVPQATATLTAVADADGHARVDDIAFSSSTCHADIYTDPWCGT